MVSPMRRDVRNMKRARLVNEEREGKLRGELVPDRVKVGEAREEQEGSATARLDEVSDFLRRRAHECRIATRRNMAGHVEEGLRAVIERRGKKATPAALDPEPRAHVIERFV